MAQTIAPRPVPASDTGSGDRSRSNNDLAAAMVDRCDRLPTTPMVGGQERLRWTELTGSEFKARVEAIASELYARGVSVRATGW
jgi:hypothetical protein